MVESSARAFGERPILVVEDDEDTVAALRMLLADEGYASITAPDVLRAIDALERDNPGLVLLDWSLDDGSGEAVLSAARQRAEPHTPVVLMTGSANLNTRSKTADAILKKPFDIGELLRVVARFYRP
jgi:DNA-binding response OmpR family regulator